jgi:carboxypeptidase T
MNVAPTGARRPLLTLLVAGLLLALVAPSTGVSAASPQQLHNYRIDGVTTREQRTAIQRAGLSIEVVGSNWVLVRGYAKDATRARALGFGVASYNEAEDFPPGYEGYHNYAEMNADIAAEVAAHPTLIKSFSIGQSYEGREVPAVLITQGADSYVKGKPEVLFDGLHHAREHLTTEMTLDIMHLFVDNYGTKQQITNLVNKRAIWVIFDVNPDGGEYDISGNQFHYWRKNRQPNKGSQYIGTDLNRNYSYKWGCCGGSSGDPSSEVYRGKAPLSSPEIRALTKFVDGRVIGGRQRITASISFHTYGELVMWPYGYTYTDVPADMKQADHDAFVKIGQQIAADTCLNGDCYTPQQASDLYIVDGDSVDWQYGVHGIFALVIEMYGNDFYVPDDVIKTQVKRLHGGVLYLTKIANCPLKVIGKSC